MRIAIVASLFVHGAAVLALALLAPEAPLTAPSLPVAIRSEALVEPAAPAREVAPEVPLRDVTLREAEPWPVPEEVPAPPAVDAPEPFVAAGSFRLPQPCRLSRPLRRVARRADEPPPPVAARALAGGATREARLLPGSPPPAYPARARRLGLEGTVVLLLHVAADGSVSDVEIAASSGHEILDRAALDSAKNFWRFEPARRGGTAIAHEVRVPVEFKLTDA